MAQRGTPLAEPLAPAPYDDDAVELLRCGGCAGAFVQRASYDRLVPARYSEDESGVLARFVAWLRAHGRKNPSARRVDAAVAVADVQHPPSPTSQIGDWT